MRRFWFLAAFVFAAIIDAGANHANAAWNKAESDHFIIYGDTPKQQLAEYAKKVERFNVFLHHRFNLNDADAAVKLTIFSVHEYANMAALIGSNRRSASNVRGFFKSGPDGSMAVVERVVADNKFSLDADVILFHEYTHYISFRYYQTAYPLWFVEGIAELLSTVEFDKTGHALVGKPALFRAPELFLGEDWSVEKVLNASYAQAYAEYSPFYGRAWLLTHYLEFSAERRGQLAKYLDLINNGSPQKEAAVAAFGDLKVLDHEVDRYLSVGKLPYQPQAITTEYAGAVTTSELPADEQATMVERLRLARGADKAEAAEIIDRLTRAQAKFPTSAFVASLIAEAHYQAGDYAAAQTAADAALALKSGDRRALRYKALAEIERLKKTPAASPADWAAVRALIIKANHLDFDDPYPLYAYYSSYVAAGEDPPKVARDGLNRAFTLDPNDRPIRSALIDLKIKERDYKTAIVLLKPIAYAPHGGEEAAKARELIDTLKNETGDGGSTPTRGAISDPHADAAKAAEPSQK